MGKGLKVVFHDNHLALDHAYELAKEGHNVGYFHEWRYRYGRVEDFVGTGIHENLNVIPDIWAKVDDAELVVIADVGYGYLGDYLRKMGHYVFGGNTFGDSLENSRLYAANVMNSFGIKTPKYYEVIGLEKLLEVAERLDYNFFLKVDVLRGNLETCRIRNKRELLVNIESAGFGPFLDKVRFIVSEPIDGIELGCDTWFNGNEFVRPYHFGNEIKGTGCCFGKWVEESIWDGVLRKFERILKGKYFGAISFEAIFDGDSLYVIDITSRFARPGGAHQYFCNRGRYGEILRAVASSEMPEVSSWAKYTVQLAIDFTEPNKWYNLGKPHPKIAVSERAVGIDGEIWIKSPEDDLGNFVHYLDVGNDLRSLLRDASDEAYSLAKDWGMTYSDEGVRGFLALLKEMERFGIDF